MQWIQKRLDICKSSWRHLLERKWYTGYWLTTQCKDLWVGKNAKNAIIIFIPLRLIIPHVVVRKASHHGLCVIPKFRCKFQTISHDVSCEIKLFLEKKLEKLLANFPSRYEDINNLIREKFNWVCLTIWVIWMMAYFPLHTLKKLE